VRREIDRFGGREVKTIGDAFLVVFDGPPSHAVRCAQAIVRAVRALDLEVRVGLHTGECEVMGGDVGGMAVHIAARVAALAAPGEVLASGTTYGTVGRGRPEVRGPRYAGAEGRAGTLAAVRAACRLTLCVQTATFAVAALLGCVGKAPQSGGST
jgi:class 3 adenylate cyclase